jgi:uncharacterized glyoxalase superfamily protein PhnB
MRPLDLARQLRREAAIEPAALERGKAVLMAAIQQEVAMRQEAAIRQEVAPARPRPIVPQLPYENILAALSFLERAFGFREIRTERLVSAGVLVHATVEFGGAVVGIGEQGGHGAVSPQSGGGESQYISVYVDDVDAHYQRAVAAGARIASELRTQAQWGHRTYEALDPEGHRWRFHQLLPEPRRTAH